MNTEPEHSKPYLLEERTLKFAFQVREFLKILPRTPEMIEDMKQLTRSTGSVGANYIEAHESLGKKNSIMHLRICLKESKESAYWLSLVAAHTSSNEVRRTALWNEANELRRIFAAMIRKAQSAN